MCGREDTERKRVKKTKSKIKRKGLLKDKIKQDISQLRHNAKKALLMFGGNRIDINGEFGTLSLDWCVIRDSLIY